MGVCNGTCTSVKWTFVKTVKGPTPGTTTPVGKAIIKTPAQQKTAFEDGCKTWAENNSVDGDCNEKGCACANNNPTVTVVRVTINMDVLTTDFDAKMNPVTYTLTGDAEFDKTRTVKECYPPKVAMDIRPRDNDHILALIRKEREKLG